MDVIEIGSPFWETEDLQNKFDEFALIYSKAPIKDNVGGMKAPHAFACWFMLKMLQPKTIIESGVWKGQGTLLLEQACPSADIICLDINLGNLIYRSPKATYIEKDFSLVDFGDIDKNTTLCFFDDHQSAIDRLCQMKWKGFNKAIFEDNYPTKRGDCYSLKKCFSNTGFENEKFSQKGFKGVAKQLLKSLMKHSSENNIEANNTHSRELMQNLKLYDEFPPLFKESKTRWGDEWDDLDYPTKKPIFDSNYTHVLRREALEYTWMCLVELS